MLETIAERMERDLREYNEEIQDGADLTVTKVGPGHYETAAGHLIDRTDGKRWYITFPGECTPDVVRDTLRECLTYIEQY